MYVLPLGVTIALASLASAIDSASPDSSTFNDPSSDYRAHFRYWLPDASIESEQLKLDISSVLSIGAGGVELVGFYNYGGYFGLKPDSVDWTAAGFGTPAYRELMLAALEAHADNDGLMDFAIGPNQGQGVPSSSDDEGLQWDLVSASLIVLFEGSCLWLTHVL